MKYFYVTYRTRDGEHEYAESGVLTAKRVEQGQEKAMKAKEVFDRPGWEEFCELEHVTEITEQDYQTLKKYVCNIDRYFNEEGELRV